MGGEDMEEDIEEDLEESMEESMEKKNAADRTSGDGADTGNTGKGYAFHPGNPRDEEDAAMLERMNVSHSSLRNWGLGYVDRGRGMKILDAGCGGGAAISYMLDSFADSLVYGVDYSPLSVGKSREYNREWLGKRCFIEQGEVRALPYGENSFDLVTAIETVYFWPEIVKAFAEVRRVLKKGGSFLVLCEGSDPDDNDWPEVDNLRIYRDSELKDIMRQAGFSGVESWKGEGQNIAVKGIK